MRKLNKYWLNPNTKANPFKRLLARAKNSKNGSIAKLEKENQAREIKEGVNGLYKAKKKKEVKITWQDLEKQWIKQGEVCYYSGLPINLMNVFESYCLDSPSIDRINNKKGYIPKNFVICLQPLNLARGDREFNYFIEWFKPFIPK